MFLPPFLNNGAETFNLRIEPIGLAVARMKMKNVPITGRGKSCEKDQESKNTIGGHRETGWKD